MTELATRRAGRAAQRPARPHRPDSGRGGAPAPAAASGPRSGPPAGKLASQVAERIQLDIAAAGWPVGTSLGSETDLADRYGVSRTVLREAVRLVEHRGVAVMRMGPGGGLTVRRPEVEAIVTAAVVYLQYVGITLPDLHEVRAVLEPLAAGLAAEAATEEAVSGLRDAIDDEVAADPATKAGPEQDRLPRLVAHASGNPAIGLFVDVLLHLTERYASYPAERDDDVLAVAQQTEIGHTAVVAAIAAGDAAGATYRARRHLELTRDWLRPRTPVSRLGSAGTDAKLAEVVANAIHTRVLAGGWDVGALLGSEADLLAEYDVSRAVLREAVRLLEHHRVVTMRRGRGGGLVVTHPDEQACIETAALYLSAQGTDLAALRVARRAVELACIELLVTRGAGPDVLERLNATLEHERACYADGHDAFGCDVHAVISELCGNPVLSLFSRILSVLWSREVALRSTSFDWRAVGDDVVGVHARIVQAVADGDADVARRRMARHIDALDAWWR